MQLLQTWIAPSLPYLTSLQRSISKMLAALVTLNPVGMLCLNQPIAPNLPPLVPAYLSSPSHWQSCIGRRSSRCRRRCRCRRCTVHRPPWWPQWRATTTGQESSPLLAQESTRSVAWLQPALLHRRLASMSQLPAPASGCFRKCKTASITAAARSGQQDQPKMDKKSSRIYGRISLDK
jgi:hypothetical protein